MKILKSIIYFILQGLIRKRRQLRLLVSSSNIPLFRLSFRILHLVAKEVKSALIALRITGPAT